MIENRQLRFRRSELEVPDGVAAAVERAVQGTVLRWYVGQMNEREVVVEATVDSEESAGFDRSVEAERYPGRSAVVSLVPTGVGCSLGGFAGDAAPVTRLLAGTADYLVTNPNAVNASDFLRMPDNVLYTEGCCIDLFCRGLVNLFVPYGNRLGVIVETSSSEDLDVVFNVINAVRAVHGVEIEHCVVTDQAIGSRCRLNQSGGYVGTVDHPEAIAITSNVQDLPLGSYARHFDGDGPNPVGGVEAIISHFIVNRFRVPAAHAPLINIKDLALADPVVDARGAGEAVSLSGLACVLMGLAAAPQIDPVLGRRSRDIVNVNNLLAVVAPASALGGIPVLAADRAGIPVFAVRDNETVLDVTAEKLGLRHVVEVGGYAEAAGLLLALRQGLSLKSLVRPLATHRHGVASRAGSEPRSRLAVQA